MQNATFGAMWTVDSDDPRGILGRYDSVCIAVLRAPIDAPFLDRLGETLTRAGEAHPEGVSAIVIRASKAPGAMGGPLREKARAILGGQEDRLRGFAYVLGGGGLKERVIRGAMGAVLRAAPFEGKMFSGPEEAVRWVVRLRGQPPAVGESEAQLLDTVVGLLGK